MKPSGKQKDMTMLEMLERHVKERADDAAVIFDPSERITFKELWELSGRVYAWLKQNEIKAEDIVLYCLPRGITLYACALGTMRAGAAFVLTEKENSSERTAFIKKDCRPSLYADEAVVKEMMKTKAMDGYEAVQEHSLCYIAYTSGTTGKPKGVLHEYGTMTNAYQSAKADGMPLLRKEDTFLLMSPMNFVSFPIVLSFSCYYGNTVALMPYAYRNTRESFLAYQKAAHVTCGYLTPSFLRANPSFTEGWRMCLLSSEPADDLFLPGTRCFNCYASTESGCLLSVFELPHAMNPAPVGKSQSDVQVFVVKEDGREAKANEEGEVCFRSPYVRGYLNLPERTRRVLRGRVLHTGDRGTIDEEGNLFLLGRIDHWFKIDGNRIDPEEIASAIRSVSDLKNFIVRGFVYRELSSIIVFYTDDTEIDPSSMREKLADLLPGYMIPTAWIHLKAFPLLETGKLDQLRLLPPEGSWEKFRTVSVSDQKEIGKGRTAVVSSLDENLVLKRYNPSIPFSVISQELLLTKEVHSLGIPGPDAYEIVRCGAGYGIILDYVKGKELEEVIKDHPEEKNEWIDRFVQEVKKIHSIAPKKTILPDLHARSMSLCEKLGSALCTKEEALKIRSIFEKLPQRHTFIHGDCHPGNVMADGKTLQFIDFTLSGTGHPVFDHLCMYSHLVFLPSFRSEDQCQKQMGMNRAEAEALFDHYLRSYYSLKEDADLARLKHLVLGMHAARFTLASLVLPGVFQEDMLQEAKERALRFAEEETDWTLL